MGRKEGAREKQKQMRALKYLAAHNFQIALNCIMQSSPFWNSNIKMGLMEESDGEVFSFLIHYNKKQQYDLFLEIKNLLHHFVDTDFSEFYKYDDAYKPIYVCLYNSVDDFSNENDDWWTLVVETQFISSEKKENK